MDLVKSIDYAIPSRTRISMQKVIPFRIDSMLANRYASARLKLGFDADAWYLEALSLAWDYAIPATPADAPRIKAYALTDGFVIWGSETGGNYPNEWLSWGQVDASAGFPTWQAELRVDVQLPPQAIIVFEIKSQGVALNNVDGSLRVTRIAPKVAVW